MSTATSLEQLYMLLGMPDGPDFHAEVRQLLRDRVLDAAYALICAKGWSAVNMSQIAATVGISRQVLYKEIGAKQALGQALAQRETDRFIDGVIAAIRAHPDDLVAGLTAGAAFTLRTGAEDALTKATLAHSQEGEAGLTPLMTAGPRPIWRGAMDAVAAAVREFYDLPESIDRQLDSIIEVDFRLTFSHLLQPMSDLDDGIRQISTTLRALVDAATAEPAKPAKPAKQLTSTGQPRRKFTM